MSTNPFDDTGGGGGAMATMHHNPQQQHANNARYARQQQQHQHQQYNRSSKQHHSDQQQHQQQTSPRHATHTQQQQQQQQQQPPIFSARGVEWPLPSTFNAAQYRKWRRESKAAGIALGIIGSGLRINNNNNSADENSGDSAAGIGGRPAFASSATTTTAAVATASASTSGGATTGTGTGATGDAISADEEASAANNTVNTTGTGNNSSGGGTTGGGGYGGLTGLMGRVLGASSPSAAGLASGANLMNDIEEEDLNMSSTRPILSPRAKCVAASNGWIVAAAECSHAPMASTASNVNVNAPSSSSSGGGGNIISGNNNSSSSNNPNMMMMQSKAALTTLIPPLRLVSRWNVRRGTALGSEGNLLVPLPPPVRPNANSATTTATAGGSTTEDVHMGSGTSSSSSKQLIASGMLGNDPNFGRIAHTFVDPTGCHVLLSARNGEAYYLHSTSKKVRKLNGFGPTADGSYSGYKPGVSLGDAAGVGGIGGSVSGSGSEALMQTGLTPGSYVTAVGWDRDRGTEGSTKRILLGTSYGELYEYSLLSPNAASSTPGKTKSTSPFDAKAGEVGNMADDYGDGDPIDTPILLRRLNATSGSSGGGSYAARATSRIAGGDGSSVGGILFQRIITGRTALNSAAGGGSSSTGYSIVLASTGGMHRHTRLHTFRSNPSSSASSSAGGNGSALSSLALRSAFSSSSDKTGSFVELPGSVEFAELQCCNDNFALQTETGIYYGSMSMMGSSVGLNTSGIASGGILDAGMLTYDCLQQTNSLSPSHQRRESVILPASIGLTPHHFITLSSTNDVKFINRVAKKVIQEERVDWVSVSQTSSSTDGDLQYTGGSSAAWGGGGASAAELLTDIRRPDQIWLRKGRSLVHISSSCEDRDVWKFTLARCIEASPLSHHVGSSQQQQQHGGTLGPDANNGPLTSEEKQIDGQFEHAKSLCSNASQRAVVNAVRAEYHLSQGRVELAAKYMAQCPSTIMQFADTAVRLALPMLGSESGGDTSYKMAASLPCSNVRHNTPRANEALASSNMALITFLNDKMKAAAKTKSDSVVTTMLGTWLTELHLQERERDGGSASSAPSGKPALVRSQSHRHVPPVNHALLHQFLSSFVRDMDPKTIINVLASHDISAGECAGYSAAAGDIGAAVNAALSGEDEKNGALDALRVLNDSPIEKAEPYYYKYALTLLSRAPMSAAKSFVARYTEGLSDTKLLPAFMHYEQRRKNHRASHHMESGGVSIANSSRFVDDENASIRYMEGAIKLGSKSRAIYNYLTALYASMEDEAPLFRFLSAHVPPASSTSSTSPIGGVSDLLLKQAAEEQKSPLDKSYALRTILRTGRHFRSAVKLYMGFGMRQQAVELALKVDPMLARELARQSEDKDETKRLWLMIARNAAANGGGGSTNSSARGAAGKDVVARVVMVLKDCGPDVLSIEDVLPFLPDFAQIDQFKDEICDALASYSSKIEHLLKEMNECDQNCDALRDELSRLKTVGTQVRADARCAFTNKNVIEEGEPFYAFPSGYVVLESALKKEIFPYLNEKQTGRVKYIENELARLRRSRTSDSRISSEVAKDDYEIEELQVEMDGLVAAECPLTGSVMVDSIDRGFPGDDEDDEFA